MSDLDILQAKYDFLLRVATDAPNTSEEETPRDVMLAVNADMRKVRDSAPNALSPQERSEKYKKDEEDAQAEWEKTVAEGARIKQELKNSGNWIFDDSGKIKPEFDYCGQLRK